MSRSRPRSWRTRGEVVRNERALFDARQQALESELAILHSQADQREQELAELQRRLAQLEGSHGLALEELKITEPLAARRIVPQIDLLRLKREVNDLAGELETTRLGIERVKVASDEAERRIEEKSLELSRRGAARADGRSRPRRPRSRRRSRPTPTGSSAPMSARRCAAPSSSCSSTRSAA